MRVTLSRSGVCFSRFKPRTTPPLRECVELDSVDDAMSGLNDANGDSRGHAVGLPTNRVRWISSGVVPADRAEGQRHDEQR